MDVNSHDISHTLNEHASVGEHATPLPNPMSPDFGQERRRFIHGALGLAGAVGFPLLSACGGGGSEAGSPAPDPLPGADLQAPTLTTSTPQAGATGVARNTAVELRFSEAVNIPSGAVTLVGPRGAEKTVMAFTTTDGVTVATLTPSARLGFGQKYAVNISAAVHDIAGNALAPTESSFTTIPRDASLELGGIIMDTYVRRRWSPPGSNAFNALPPLVDNGFEWLRAAVTTHSWPELRKTEDWGALGWRNEYWSCLEVTGALMREAADLGMRLHAVLFLSDAGADWGRQHLPVQWQGLDASALATAVEAHARDVALYYQSLNLPVEIFEIGNEIDAGAFGRVIWDTVPVPDGIDPFQDPAWMRSQLWTPIAPLLRAAIRGVRSVYPAAQICLHVAGLGYSPDDRAAGDFFESMEALNVPFDVMGLSYPYMQIDQGLPQPFFESPRFDHGLQRLSKIGRPIHIVEMGYNAKPEGTRATPSPRYPLTPKGQADYLQDFSRAIRGRVKRLIAFYPDLYDGFSPNTPELEGMGLFSAPGVPRPALEVFNAIAEGRLFG